MIDFNNKELLKLSEELQDECQSTCKIVVNRTGVSYQDAINTWFFTKIAELQLKVNELQLANQKVYNSGVIG